MPTYTLVANRPSGDALHHLVFDTPVPDHVEPGQFIVATAGADHPSYFAIASAPGEPLELLVKRQPGAAEALCDLPVGAPLVASEAQGPGFRAAATRPRPLVCLVNGSALSAVRPVLRAELDAGLPRPVHLLYGVLSADHVAFADELPALRAAGVSVTVVLDPAAPDPGTHPVGFVQDIAQAQGLLHPDVALLLCGVPAMADDARQRFVAAGGDPTLVLTNF